MKIQYVHGNLLDTEIRHVVQSANAQGVMRSGIAGVIRDKYPEVYEAYRNTYEYQNHSLRLGQIIWVPTSDGLHVIGSLIGQDRYGRDPKTVYADYNAIERAMISLDAYMEGFSEGRNERPKVAMPLIGAGLANGSWQTISQIIEKNAIRFKPVVHLLDGKLPNV